MPRPVAVLAESAERGNFLLQAAEATNLIIPRHCALLVIERNTLLCAATRPRLSHAYPSATDEGYKAAALLEDLMSRKKTRRRQIMLETPLIFNDAESTAFVSPAAALIKNASEIINTDFTLLADAEAVAARLGVSRRLLDLRFREYTGKTVAEILRAKKLNSFAAKLAESKESISSLAESCGFPNASYLKTLFKRSYGVSPGVYRQSAAIGGAGAASIRR
jgi:LacI family transcriptional regulator